jgi:hypothetical protein
VREAILLVQVEMSGPRGDFSWPFATCSAIDDHTLLTTAREAAQLATWHGQGCRIWATSPSSGLKVPIRDFRVPRDFVALAETPGDWIFVNLGLLTTDAKLPATVRLASGEEMAELEDGMPLSCVGYPHDGGKITRFDTFEPRLYPGKLYLATWPGGAATGGLLELQAELPKNFYGSPAINRRGAVVGIYGEAASSDTIGVKNLHYVTALDRGLLRSWLEGRASDAWVSPPIPGPSAPKQ